MTGTSPAGASEVLPETLRKVSAESLLDVEFHCMAGALAVRAKFSLRHGRTALFGPSGSGKTTVLRTIAGLSSSAVAGDLNGRIALSGRVLLDTAAGVLVAAGARRVGYLPQAPALFPHLSVARNVRFGLRGLAQEVQERRVDEMLQLAGLDTLRDRLPGRLSGGERQRVALARALAPGPQLLLLDEPFSGLDRSAKNQLWNNLLPYLERQGIAMMLVTHDVAEAWRRTERVVRMSDGAAELEGATRELLTGERAGILRQLD
jgi:molybdate transport system ATP-binding protein